MPPMKKTRNTVTETGQTMAVEQSSAQVVPQIVSQIAPATLTLAEVRAMLDGKTGKRYGKNLDDLAETQAFHEMLAEEFPRQATGSASEFVDAVSRRGFMK